MRLATRKWAYRAIVPVLGLGLLGLLLLPAAPATVAHVEAAQATKAAAAAALPVPMAQPVFVKTSLIVPANEHTEPLPPAPGTAPPVVRLLPNWSDYIKASATAAVTGPTTDGQVGAEAVNVHTGPGGAAAVAFVLSAGEPVKIAETNGGWVHVYRQSGEDGWVFGRYLAGHDTAPAPAVVASAAPAQAAPSAPADGNARLVGRMVHVRDPVAVRAQPGGFAAIVTVMQPGDAMRVTDLRDGWLHVTTEDGVTGWVPG